MRSPAAAIAWEFRQRHRWALIALAGYVLFVAAFKLLILGPGTTVRLDPPDGRAAAVIVPLSATFMYLLAVFSFGVAGDLAARQSIYPARMFALPVTTAALAGWPMLYGTSAMASLWLVTALLAQWPWGIEVPVIWPALLAAAFLAWTQALMWMPYGLPGLRVIVAVLWLVALDAVVILAIHYEAPESLMVGFLAPQLPLAYLAACFAVARARRGDVPDWRGMVARIGEIAEGLLVKDHRADASIGPGIRGEMGQRKRDERIGGAMRRWNGRGNAIFRKQQDQRRGREVTPQVNVLHHPDPRGGKAQAQGPADRIRIHRELDALVRLGGEENHLAVVKRVCAHPFFGPPLPHLHLQSPLHRGSQICKIHPQREGMTQLEEAVKAHLRRQGDLRRGKGRKKKEQERGEKG